MKGPEQSIFEVMALLVRVERKFGIAPLPDEHWTEFLLRLWRKIDED